jgi:hypothetical protein
VSLHTAEMVNLSEDDYPKFPDMGDEHYTYRIARAIMEAAECRESSWISGDNARMTLGRYTRTETEAALHVCPDEPALAMLVGNFLFGSWNDALYWAYDVLRIEGHPK